MAAIVPHSPKIKLDLILQPSASLSLSLSLSRFLSSCNLVQRYARLPQFRFEISSVATRISPLIAELPNQVRQHPLIIILDQDIHITVIIRGSKG